MTESQTISTDICPAFLAATEDNQKLIVGGYELLESANQRIGSLDYYEFDDNNQLHRTKRLLSDCAGVFRVQKVDGGFLCPMTDGKLVLIDRQLQSTTHEVIDEKMLLCADCHTSNQSIIVCGVNSGEVLIYSLTNQSILNRFTAHQLPHCAGATDCETWTVKLIDQNCILSGGDDGLLKLWDTRLDSSVTTNRSHSAGVTYIGRLKHQSTDLVLTGSYDETLRLLDLRKLNGRQSISEVKLGGGVWHVNESPLNSKDSTELLVSCMYNGYKLVNYIDDSLTMIDSDSDPFIDGKQLIYGTEYLINRKGGINQVYASFYDKQLHLIKTGH